MEQQNRQRLTGGSLFLKSGSAAATLNQKKFTRGNRLREFA
jgi:hypothetical protein